MARIRIPTLPEGVVIRLAEGKEELAIANRLVFENYVAEGFWEPDETQLSTNPFLHSPHRVAWLAVENGRILGTMSIIHDNPSGLPSDKGQPMLMKELRATGERIAEVCCVATQRGRNAFQIILFLMAYGLQYSFHQTRLDRLVASCKPQHADFYEKILHFSKVSKKTYYEYSHAVGYLISLHLLEAHRLLADRYPPPSPGERSFYDFLLGEAHPSFRFPRGHVVYRRRDQDWLAAARAATAAEPVGKVA